MSGFTSGTNMKSFKTENEDKRLCKVFIKKAHNYKDTMREDKFSKATLDSYKQRVVSHCSTVAASSKMRSILTSTNSKVLCKASIKDAHEYKATMNDSKSNKETMDEHKENVISSCGTIIAKS